MKTEQTKRPTSASGALIANRIKFTTTTAAASASKKSEEVREEKKTRRFGASGSLRMRLTLTVSNMKGHKRDSDRRF